MYLFFSVFTTFYVSSFSTINAQHLKSSNCSTPDGIGGYCISIYQCTPLLKKLDEKPLRQETIDYITGYHCGFDGLVPHVCCPPNINSPNPNLNKPLVTTTETSISTLENVNNNDAIMKLLDNPLLPRDCGRDSTPRDLKSANTTLGEFPWLVLLEYVNGNSTLYPCIGALISKRYVLTGATCLIESSVWKLSRVRLGVHDLRSAQNCVKHDDVDICSDGSIRVEIEESFIHELFSRKLANNYYDIGLIRLSRDIVSTYYVKPICLPRSSVIDRRLYAAGWGSTLTSLFSNVKLKVSVPFFDKDSCNRIYKFMYNITLIFEQICAGGEKDRDACFGDGGGPLMDFQDLPNGDKIWKAIGIVSFGPTTCGHTNLPSVYTKVYDFIPWIISKMRP